MKISSLSSWPNVRRPSLAYDNDFPAAHEVYNVALLIDISFNVHISGWPDMPFKCLAGFPFSPYRDSSMSTGMKNPTFGLRGRLLGTTERTKWEGPSQCGDPLRW